MSVSLEKGQKISLEKEAGGSLSKIFVGCGWDMAKGIFGLGSGSVDLDLSAIMYDENKNVVDTVWFRQLKSNDGSVSHSGDNRTGEGDGDDEVIKVDLTRVPAKVTNIVFTINNYTGQNFSKVASAFCRVVVDDSSKKELVNYNLSAKGEHTALVIARIYKHNNEWKAQAIGEVGNGRVVSDLVTFAKTTF